MIEINLLNLLKNERGTHEGYVTVHHQGKIFQRKQRLGRKIEKNTMSPNNIKEIQSLENIGISGNIHDKESFIVKFKNNSQALYKTIEPIGIIGEVNAFKISEILGWNIVPETVKGNFGHGMGSCQKWVDGEEVYSREYNNYGKKLTKKNIDDLAKIFAFDIITNNRDRHVGNFLVSNNKIWAIDNEEFGYLDAGKYLMERLDDACNYGNQIGWGILQAIEDNFDNDQKIYKYFRNLVIKKLKEIVDKENKILEIYKPIKDYNIKRKSIEESFNYIKNRIAEFEEKNDNYNLSS